MEHGPNRPGLFRNRRVWLLILVTVVGLLIGYYLLDAGGPCPDNPPVSPPPAGDVSCLGRLLPGGRILRIAVQSGAVIGELDVRRGQWVERGEILARLRDYARDAASLLRAEKEVSVAVSEFARVRAGEKANTIGAQQAAVARQEAILRQKDAQYERIRKLHERRIVATRDFEEAQVQRDEAVESLRRERQHLESLRDVRAEDLALAASRVEAAEGARKVAQATVELNLVRAPVSGRVLDIHAFPGEVVTEKGILELGSGGDMMVEAEVYVSDIGRVRIGAQAFVTGDAFPGRIQGRVVEIASLVARSAVLPSDPLAFSDQRVVKVLIRLDDSRTVARLGNHQVSVTIKP